MPRDKLFFRFVLLLAGLMVLFGLGSVVLSIFTDPTDVIILRILTAFSAMFSGLIGIGLGYLIGKNGGGNGSP